MDDHCPMLSDDTDFPGNVGGYRSRLFAQGYIQGLIESVTKEQEYGGPVRMSEVENGFVS
jgi:D-mannonate dehydratase